MSTRVELCAIWFNLADDLSVWINIDRATPLTRTSATNGRVQATAAGRRRRIRTVGTDRTWSTQMTVNDPDQVQWLEDHVGELMCVRDNKGHKMFVVYDTVQMDDHDYNTGSNTSLELTEITFSEAV